MEGTTLKLNLSCVCSALLVSLFPLARLAAPALRISPKWSGPSLTATFPSDFSILARLPSHVTSPPGSFRPVLASPIFPHVLSTRVPLRHTQPPPTHCTSLCSAGKRIILGKGRSL